MPLGCWTDSQRMHSLSADEGVAFDTTIVNEKVYILAVFNLV